MANSVIKKTITSGDIIDNLTSTATDKPLSAAQGKLIGKNLAQLNADTDAISDCNALTATGVYKAINSTLNKPTTNGHYIIYHAKYTTGEMTQTAIYTADSTTYTRVFYNNSWSSWKRLICSSDVVDSLTSTATDKPLSANMGKTLNEKIAIVSKRITLGVSFTPAQTKECVFDISDLKQTYSEVYLLNFAGVNGSNYISFQFCFGYEQSNNNRYSVVIRNNSTSDQTASSFDVQFLCIK